MPMIKVETSVSLAEEKRCSLKAELGKAVSIIGKPESYLMINLVDKQDLYFGGNKMEKAAYVEVKLFGSIDSGKSSKMTEKICEILEDTIGVPKNAIYVAYFGTSEWGWNGSNF